MLLSDCSPLLARANSTGGEVSIDWVAPEDVDFPDALGLRFTSPAGGLVTCWFEGAAAEVDEPPTPGFRVGVSGSGIANLTLGMTILLMDGAWQGFVIEGEVLTV